MSSMTLLIVYLQGAFFDTLDRVQARLGYRSSPSIPLQVSL
jgi:hypothetical protein